MVLVFDEIRELNLLAIVSITDLCSLVKLSIRGASDLLTKPNLLVKSALAKFGDKWRKTTLQNLTFAKACLFTFVNLWT